MKKFFAAVVLALFVMAGVPLKADEAPAGATGSEQVSPDQPVKAEKAKKPKHKKGKKGKKHSKKAKKAKPAEAAPEAAPADGAAQ